MSSPQYQQNIAPAAVTLLGGGLLVLAGLTFVGTVIGLVAATPLLVVFSPVVVPAAVALFLMVSGLVVSGVCGAAAAGMFYWVYCYAGVRGVRIIGAERAKEKLVNAAHEMKQRIAAAVGLGSPAGEDQPPPVTAGGRENNLDRDIAVD